MKLKTKLILTFGILALIPLILTSLVSYSSAQRALIGSERNTIEAIADMRAGDIQQFFNDVREQMSIVKEYVNVKAGLPIMSNFFRNTSNPEYLREKNILDAQLGEWIATSSEIAGQINDIMLVNKDGIIVYSASQEHAKEEIGMNISEKNDLVFSEGRKDIYISGLFRDKTNGSDPIFWASAPVTGSDGRFAGVAILEISAKELYSILRDPYGLGMTGEVVIGEISDSCGEIKAQKCFVFLSPTLADKNGGFGKHFPFGDSSGEPMQSALGKISGSGFSVDYAGNKVLAAWRFLPDQKWGLVAKINADEIFQILNPLYSSLLILVVISMIGIMIVVLLLTKEIVEPLEEITAIANKISGGNLSILISGKLKAGGDEVAQLSNAFQKMSGNLRNFYAELEKQVDERTKDFRKFKLAADNAYEHIIITDIDGTVMYANKAVERITGYRPEEVIGKKAGALWHLPMAKKFYEEFWDTIKNKKKTFVGELKNKRKNGEIYTAIISVSPILDEKGNIMFFVGIENDVSKERAATEANEKLAAIVRDTADAVVSDDLNGKILSWNKGAERIYGYAEEDAIGKDVRDLILPKDGQKEIDEILGRVKKGERVENYETRRVRKNGKIFNASVTYSPIRDESGNIIAASVIARDVTERVKMEEQLIENERELTEAQRVGRIGNWSWDIATDTIVWSDEYYRIFGFDPKKKPPKYEEHLKVYTSESAARLDAAVKKNAEMGKPYELDLEIANPKEGAAQWITARSETIRDLSGKIIGLRGTAQDITKRKRAEIEREQFFKFFNISNDIMVIADPLGNFKRVNPASLRILGYSEAELISKPFIEFVHPDDQQSTREEMAKQMKMGSSLNFINRYVCKDGNVLWLSWRANYDKNEGITYATARDITKERAVSEINEKLATIVRYTGDAVVSTDLNVNITSWNKGAEDMTGYSEKEALTKDIKSLVIPAERMKEIGYVMDKLKKGEKIENYETQLVRKNKTVFDANLTISPIVDESKNITGISVIARDITRAKEMEQAKNDFLSLASHQLRTPLSGMRWLLETLRRKIFGDLSHKQKEYIDEVYQMNNRMIELVSSMLDILRLESGQAFTKKEKIPVSKFSDDIAEMMGPVAKSKKIIMNDKLKGRDDIVIFSDFQAVKNILETFVSNAVSYSPEGKKIEVGIKEEGRRAVFYVKDQGIGIPEEERPHIFERFFRGYQAKNIKPAGTGLGLSLAALIANKVGGKLSFESKEGKGSTFYLSIDKGGE